VNRVLGIDPGTRKVGFAIAADTESPPLALGIEPLETLVDRLMPLLRRYPVDALALGAGTNASRVAKLLGALGLPVHLIDEHDTTYRARALYFAANPPSGWRRLIPLGLQLPPRPIDDYAALLIARRYIEGSRVKGL
jgi:RNase H-fold protein (predicted Holliday junction resolvase)